MNQKLKPKHKLTKNQTLVLKILEKANTPLSAYSLLDKLREHGFKAPPQVYRALDKLMELNKEDNEVVYVHLFNKKTFYTKYGILPLIITFIFISIFSNLLSNYSSP